MTFWLITVLVAALIIVAAVVVVVGSVVVVRRRRTPRFETYQPGEYHSLEKPYKGPEHEHPWTRWRPPGGY